jgi:hypothetical protein
VSLTALRTTRGAPSPAVRPQGPVRPSTGRLPCGPAAACWWGRDGDIYDPGDDEWEGFSFDGSEALGTQNVPYATWTGSALMTWTDHGLLVWGGTTDRGTFRGLVGDSLTDTNTGAIYRP